MKFTIVGPPQGKARPRFARGVVYTPPDTANYERVVGLIYKASKGKLLEGEVIVTIDAFFDIPKSAKKAEAKQGVIRPKVKPDVDNIAKIILDGLNGVAYSDDSHVVSLTVNKRYSANPRVEVEVTEIEDSV